MQPSWGAPGDRPPTPDKPLLRRPGVIIALIVAGLLVVGGVNGALSSTAPSSTTVTTRVVAAGPAATEPATTAGATTVAPKTTVPATTTAPKPKPTRPPRTQPPVPPLTVRIVSLAPSGQGNPATAVVQTVGGARCDIEVDYASGPSTAAGLDPKTAPASGAIYWTWLVGTRTTPGSWPVSVTCEKGGDSRTVERELVVRDTGKPG